MMFSDFANQVTTIISQLRVNTPVLLVLIGCLYLIHIINWIVGYRLNYLGIYPRKSFGLVGIIFSPFLHGNFNHLFFNSIPLFILASFVLFNGWTIFICVSVIIIVLGGIATWCFGRKGLHIGASGLIMGYWSYLLINAYHQGTWLSIVLAVVCVYYFGGLLFHLIPKAEKSSWEGHVFGFLSGLAAAYIVPFILLYLHTNIST